MTQIRHLTSGSGQYLIVAEDAGSLVGLLSFGRLGFKKIKHRGGLMMMVRPESRGRGVGHRLLASLLDRAKADPTLERLDLSVMASNHLAIRLYERAGFAYEGRRPRAYRLDDGTFEDEVFMGLVLRR